MTLDNSSREAQEIIDSDAEHCQKTTVKVLSLKTRINDKKQKYFRFALVTVKSLIFLIGNRDKDKHNLCERKRRT